MQIRRPKSHDPTIHDNTEKDLILVSPSVLDNKLRDMEAFHKARGGIGSDISLTATFLIAVLTATFQDIPYISGPTLRGAFMVGFLVTLVKIGYDLYIIFWRDHRDRASVLDSLLEITNSKDK